MAGVIGKKSFGKLHKEFALFLGSRQDYLDLCLLCCLLSRLWSRGHIGRDWGNIDDGIVKSIQLNEFFLSLIPAHCCRFEGLLLPIIKFFAIFLSYGLGSLKEDKSQKFIDLLQIWQLSFTKLSNGVIIKLSPLNFRFYSQRCSHNRSWYWLVWVTCVAGTYLAYVVLVLVIFSLIALIFGVLIWQDSSELEPLTWLLFLVAPVLFWPPSVERSKGSKGHDEHVIDLSSLSILFNLEGALLFPR